MTANNKTRLTVDSRLENLPVIHDFIAAACRQMGIKHDILKIQLAVEEACTNIIKYAYPERTGKITIFCELTDNSFVITIHDKGLPFDPTSVPPPDLEAEMENRQIGKLGMHLIRNLMDDVSYSFDDEQGNTLIMKRKLRKPHV